MDTLTRLMSAHPWITFWLGGVNVLVLQFLGVLDQIRRDFIRRDLPPNDDEPEDLEPEYLEEDPDIERLRRAA